MLIIGHRGASGYKPENTLASIQEAISLGVDIMEIDVHTLATGEVVVLHDETVDRTTNGTGAVSAMSLAQLKLLTTQQNEKIPLLTEVLDLIDRRMPINIELKAKHTAPAVARIIRKYMTKKNWSSSLFSVSSFDHNELNLFATLLPSIRTGALFDTQSIRYKIIKSNNAEYSVNLDSKYVTRKLVEDSHEHGEKVYVYTVNDRKTANRMRKMKVDGVFTDYPDRVLAIPS